MIRGLAGVVAGVTLALGGAAVAAPVYSFMDLGTLGGDTFAYDVNNLGQVVGSSVNAAGQTEAFRTAPNLPINPLTDRLGFLPGGATPSSAANAINDLGQVVGNSSSANGTRGFFTGPNGNTLNDIGVFPGFSASQASGINNAGQIVGFTNTSAASVAFRTTSARPLDQNTDALEPVGLPPPSSSASDVNNAGQAVGGNRGSGFRTTPNGTIIQGGGGIGSLGGSTTYVFAVNNSGQAAGHSETTSLLRHAFRTGPNAGINPATDDLGTLGGTTSFAKDINDAGVVVGVSDAPGQVGPGLAFVYIDGEGMIDLNTLTINRPAGWTLNFAEGINNLGQIVGWAAVDGQVHAFLLTPVPEPGAALLLPAAGLLLKRRRGR
jgi:probable HAF family extracellular repeat protein